MSPPRLAVPADAAAIARVELAGAPRPWDEAAVRARLEGATTRAWVTGDPIEGHVLTWAAAEEAEVLALTVEPGARRRGHARALLQTCSAAWVELGIEVAWLEVRADNTPAQRLYEGLGWVAAGRRPRYYDDGTDAVLMRWQPS